jgi:hypothetical protein
VLTLIANGRAASRMACQPVAERRKRSTFIAPLRPNPDNCRCHAVWAEASNLPSRKYGLAKNVGNKQLQSSDLPPAPLSQLVKHHPACWRAPQPQGRRFTAPIPAAASQRCSKVRPSISDARNLMGRPTDQGAHTGIDGFGISGRVHAHNSWPKRIAASNGLS